MTKIEVQKRLLESLELMVGDRIKVTQKNYVHTNKIFVVRETEDKVKDEYNDYYLELENSCSRDKMYSLSILVEKDWEKVETPLKDKKCDDFEGCVGCPLHDFYCADLIYGTLSGKTISEVYNRIEKKLFIAKKEIFEEEK